MESSACADCVWRCGYLCLILCLMSDSFFLVYKCSAEYNVRVLCDRWMCSVANSGIYLTSALSGDLEL